MGTARGTAKGGLPRGHSHGKQAASARFTRFSAFPCSEAGHRATVVRFDDGSVASYLSGMSQDAPEELENAAPGKDLSEAAKRALREAAARRKADREAQADRPAERNGPSGKEPTRFGDWERGGIAYDF